MSWSLLSFCGLGGWVGVDVEDEPLAVLGSFRRRVGAAAGSIFVILGVFMVLGVLNVLKAWLNWSCRIPWAS